MKLSIKLKANLFIIFVILAQSTPFSFNVMPGHLPELLSLVIYITYSLNKEALGYFNLVLISLLNDMIKLNYIGTSVMQYFVYAFYIDKLKRIYIHENLLIEWVGFALLNIVLLPCKYSLLNFIRGSDVIFTVIAFEKTLITIACFPAIYYFINKLVK
ncbi:hypothetical protein [Candidatus Bandiella euplotis]|uniref:Rod shape-determining protein MreD n=1 Tax=Candidatus Bandiella euplotis TaxID=1664265 RepID=A0ABZ0ULV9_9RICK|nr:hypothetical protein [Candidatus Bandiella woodruffii]WPX96709.1 hypothetical protein Bandiella_00831 [Candidatus Bandiella woodruffii]